MSKRRPGEVLARYRDPSGAEHALVLLAGREGQLLVDRSSAGEWVVAELNEQEGREQALAVLRDADGNTEGLAKKPPIVGYIARASESGRRLCRALVAVDLPDVGEGGRRAAA